VGISLGSLGLKQAARSPGNNASGQVLLTMFPMVSRNHRVRIAHSSPVFGEHAHLTNGVESGLGQQAKEKGG
jgi:hypothetical protein